MKLGLIISMLEKEHDASRLLPPAGTAAVDCMEVDVLDCTHDTRRVTENCLFACVPGSRFDGHDFADEAFQKGAAALLCERELPESDIPQIIVKDVRSVLGKVAASIHGNPSDSMMMIAVTGTNGKTTTAHMIRRILQEGGYKTGMIGTIFYDTGKGPREADRTTPESTNIQRMLGAMLKNGCRACVMEASSHGLAQGRLSGCRFDASVFTNLTEEHLDFHGNMERYFSAKSLLFSHYAKNEESLAVINADDNYGARLGDNAAGIRRARGYERARARFHLLASGHPPDCQEPRPRGCLPRRRGVEGNRQTEKNSRSFPSLLQSRRSVESARCGALQR